MGRRSLHSPEELRRMILTSSREIVERDGMKGLSARAIAKKIGYSPGTLYNVFKNLDDLLLTIQIALAEEALTHLRAVPNSSTAENNVRAISRSYMGFALNNKRLWNLLFQHTPPTAKPANEVLAHNLDQMTGVIRQAVEPLMAGRGADDIEHTARAIWMALHGMSSIAVNDKMASSAVAAIPEYADMLVDGMLALLEQQARATP